MRELYGSSYMAVKVPKPPARAGKRRTTETRIRLIALLCTFAAFVALGIFLLLDYQEVEQRNASLASTAGSGSTRADPAVPAAAGPGPELQSPPKAPEPPARVAGTASQTLNDVLKAASANDWARVDQLLAGASASVGSGGEAPASPLAEEGRKAIAAGDYGKAVEALTGAIAANAQDADALNSLAFAFLRRGELEDAYALVTRSLELSPARAATWANSAEILAERDNGRASQAALRVAIHLARDRDRTRRFLNEADQNVPSAKFRAVIAQVLPKFDSIPKAGRSPS